MYECEKAREVGFIGHTLRSVGGSQAPTQEWSVKRESAEKAYASYASAHRDGGDYLSQFSQPKPLSMVNNINQL